MKSSSVSIGSRASSNGLKTNVSRRELQAGGCKSRLSRRQGRPAIIRKGEVAGSVAPVERAQQSEQGLVLIDGQ